MCLFQQLPSSNIVIEEKDKDETSSTTIINDNDTKMETNVLTTKNVFLFNQLFCISSLHQKWIRFN
jgi:hypothetical protein